MRIQSNKKVIKNITTACSCDGCGKVVKTNYLPDNWFHFNSNHCGWGNDSVDSIEEYDVCSAECFIKVLKNIFKKNPGCILDYDSGEIAEMPIKFVKELIKKYEK